MGTSAGRGPLADRTTRDGRHAPARGVAPPRVRGVDDDQLIAAAAVQRRWIADLADTLDAAQLATPSLCGGWDVRTVLGHLVVSVDPDLRRFARALLRSGGRPHRANDLVARERARVPVAELTAALRAHAASRFAPPVVGLLGPSTDALVHAADICVPLGLPHDPDTAAVTRALDFLTTGRPVGFVPRGRLAGLRLVAEDSEWSWGTGAALRGRGIDLAVAACGRPAVLDRLTGPGVDVLRRRLG